MCSGQRKKHTYDILRNLAISIGFHIYQVILPMRVHFSNRRDFGALERIRGWGEISKLFKTQQNWIRILKI
jgi:hypothetical protein